MPFFLVVAVGCAQKDWFMLRVFNLKKSYGGHDVLKGVSFELGDRDRVAVVGTNGAGKSSLLKIIAGELAADEGAVTLKGVTPSELAYLPQDAGVRSGRSLWDELLSTRSNWQSAMLATMIACRS